MSSENPEVAVEAAEEKTETKEVKGTKRAADVSGNFAFLHKIKFRENFSIPFFSGKSI